MMTTTLKCDLCKIQMGPKDKFYTLIIEEHNKGAWVARVPGKEICPKCYKSLMEATK